MYAVLCSSCSPFTMLPIGLSNLHKVQLARFCMFYWCMRDSPQRLSMLPLQRPKVLVGGANEFDCVCAGFWSLELFSARCFAPSLIGCCRLECGPATGIFATSIVGTTRSVVPFLRVLDCLRFSDGDCSSTIGKWSRLLRYMIELESMAFSMVELPVSKLRRSYCSSWFATSE